MTIKNNYAELIIKANENEIAKVGFENYDTTKIVENLEYACVDKIFNFLLNNSYIALGAEND